MKNDVKEKKKVQSVTPNKDKNNNSSLIHKNSNRDTKKSMVSSVPRKSDAADKLLNKSTKSIELLAEDLSKNKIDLDLESRKSEILSEKNDKNLEKMVEKPSIFFNYQNFHKSPSKKISSVDFTDDNVSTTRGTRALSKNDTIKHDISSLPIKAKLFKAGSIMKDSFPVSRHSSTFADVNLTPNTSILNVTPILDFSTPTPTPTPDVCGTLQIRVISRFRPLNNTEKVK